MTLKREWAGQVESSCIACGSVYYTWQRELDHGSKTCSQRCYHDSRKRSLSDRFWEKVDKNGPIPKHVPHLGRCWIWIGALYGPKGRKWRYGAFGAIPNASPQPAHRVAWELKHGPIHDGVRILHKCDNPPCVREHHLFSGSNKDNIQDMIKKGRDAATRAPRPTYQGSKNQSARLTEATVLVIRKEYEAGHTTHVRLAKKYKTSQTNVHLILRRKKRKYI